MTDKRDERDVGIDTTRPSIARAYDVVLNGKDNFEVDRAFVAEIVKIVPEIYDVATYNRQVLGRGCGSWRSRASPSSSTSARGCRPWRTLTRSPRA